MNLSSKPSLSIRFISALLFVFIITKTSAQSEGINFQGVARNSNGVILASQKISLKFSIINLTETGAVEYIEIRNINTNAQGIFSIIIGASGSVSTIGNFSNINWKQQPKFLKVEMDPNAGIEFVNMGTTQLQKVPYAYYANGVNASNIDGILPVSSGGTGTNNLTSLKSSLSLDLVNNTSDINKPISAATNAALDLKANLSDVTNSLALKANTSDVVASIGNKVNSSDLNTFLLTKVDKVVGKDLSTNDFTNAEKTKLAAITGMNTGDQDLSAYATNAALELKANTSDVTTNLLVKENSSNKSTANDLGGASSSDVLYPTQKSVKSYVDENIRSDIKLKSLNGLRDSIQTFTIGNAGFAPSIQSIAAVHTLNLPFASTPSVTAGLIAKTEFDKFFNKSDFSGNYNDLFNKPVIPEAQIQTNWAQTDNTKLDFIQNKPTYATVASTGSFNDLTDQPTLINLGGIPSSRKITINGASYDLSQDRTWVVNPVVGSVSMETDVKDVLSVSNGGTGSSSKNFVDLTTNQNIDGVKNFTNSISVGAASAETTAIVDINSTSKGFLPPRLTTAQRDAILNPAIGLTIFNTETNCLEWWIGSIWYNACGNASVSTTTNGTANVTIIDCASGTANGISGGAYDIGTPVNSGGSWQVLNLKVNSIGNYNFTATANGITYSAIGQFYESDRLASISGTKAVYMYASGAAQNAGTFSYKLATLPTCVFTNNVNKTSSNGSSVIDAWASPSVEYGSLMQGAVVSGVNQKLKALVSTTPGTYKIVSTQNGITFTGEGNFPTANALYDVVLTATGIPTNAGTYTFTTNTTPSFTFTRTVLSPSSNGTAVVNSWTGNTESAGTIYVSNLISGANITQTLTADVAVVGDYSINAVLNGITFSGTGTFTGTGSQTVVLTASGTPTTIGSNIFTLNTMPSATFERLVNANTSSGGTAVVTTWTNSGDFGSMTVGDPVSYVSHTVTAFVSKLGTYNISASSNGVVFFATGSFTSLGYQNVVMNATGNPTTIGNSSWVLNVSNPCSFLRSVMSQPTTYGTAIINSYTGGTSSGNLYVNKPVSGVTFTVNAEVTRAGTYLIDAIIYGVTYVAQGTFTSTGTVPITFVASGTPNTITSFKLLLISVTNVYSTPSIQIYANPSSNGTANITNWTLGSQNGTAFVGVPVQNVTQQLIANVTNAGTYSISTTVNGVTFASSGTFAGTGSQTVTLAASGTPLNTWNTINTINTTPSVTFTYQYLSLSSNGTSVISSWSNGNISGSVYAGSQIYNTTFTVTANVVSVGTYKIEIVNNGIILIGIGTFTRIGSQTVILSVSGQPIAAGTHSFSFNTNPNYTFNINTYSNTTNGTAIINNLRQGSATGTLIFGTPVSNVTQELIVNVTQVGTYNIYTSANGVTFAATGNFTSLGDKTISLIASGTPGNPPWNAYPLNGLPFGVFTRTVVIPPIGSRVAGGVLAYILQPSDPGYSPDIPHGLIASIADISSSSFWYTGSDVLSGADGLIVGTGYSNSAKIFVKSTVMNAALQTLNYSNDGYNDWYLPSIDELYMLYLNRIAIGGFGNGYYWSSSEIDELYAWTRKFDTGNLYGLPKNQNFSVRAIRSF